MTRTSARVALDVLALLLQALLDEDLVDDLQAADDRGPLLLGEHRDAALLGEVQRVGGHPDDQPVTELAGPLEHPQVTDVEDVEGAEGDDGATH